MKTLTLTLPDPLAEALESHAGNCNLPVETLAHLALGGVVEMLDVEIELRLPLALTQLD